MEPVFLMGWAIAQEMSGHGHDQDSHTHGDMVPAVPSEPYIHGVRLALALFRFGPRVFLCFRHRMFLFSKNRRIEKEGPKPT